MSVKPPALHKMRPLSLNCVVENLDFIRSDLADATSSHLDHIKSHTAGVKNDVLVMF